jgi:hypothetical protein
VATENFIRADAAIILLSVKAGLRAGKSWSNDNCEGACRRSEHPIGDLIKPALRLSDQEVVEYWQLLGGHGITGQCNEETSFFR